VKHDRFAIRRDVPIRTASWGCANVFSELGILLSQSMRLESHANVYADLLNVPTDGWALWNPDHDGVVGDCGVIVGGTFYKASTLHSVDLCEFTLAAYPAVQCL